MLKCLTTFGFGPDAAAMLRVSLPTHLRYCETHDYDLVVPQMPAVGRFRRANGRHASWFKVAMLESLLDAYDVVLWLDADVAVLRHDVDILADATDAPMHMVVHHTPDGAVPNCGVWLVRKTAKPFLANLWDAPESSRSGCWWEQAAVIHGLGGDPNATPVAVPAGPLWGELPYQWNPHLYDGRGIPADARFFHATMFADRVQALKEAIDAS